MDAFSDLAIRLPISFAHHGLCYAIAGTEEFMVDEDDQWLRLTRWEKANGTTEFSDRLTRENMMWPMYAMLNGMETQTIRSMDEVDESLTRVLFGRLFHDREKGIVYIWEDCYDGLMVRAIYDRNLRPDALDVVDRGLEVQINHILDARTNQEDIDSPPRRCGMYDFPWQWCVSGMGQDIWCPTYEDALRVCNRTNAGCRRLSWWGGLDIYKVEEPIYFGAREFVRHVDGPVRVPHGDDGFARQRPELGLVEGGDVDARTRERRKGGMEKLEALAGEEYKRREKRRRRFENWV